MIFYKIVATLFILECCVLAISLIADSNNKAPDWIKAIGGLMVCLVPLTILTTVLYWIWSW